MQVQGDGMTTREAISSISEKTKIPLSLVISLVVFVATLVLWGKGLEARVEGHETTDNARVTEIKDEQAQVRKDVTEIKINLAALLGSKGLRYQRFNDK